MAAADKTEHDFLSSGDKVSLKEFLLGIINERERQWEQRFAVAEAHLKEIRLQLIEAHASFAAKEDVEINTDRGREAINDALVVANEKLTAAIATIDARINATVEHRQHMAIQLQHFALKSEVRLEMDANQKAVEKAEGAANQKFASVNEFRAQLNDVIATFVPRDEINVRFEALTQKLEAAAQAQANLNASFQQTKGRGDGTTAAWALVMTGGTLLLTLVMAATGVIVLFARH